jgi:hypothetical protein
MQAGIKTQKFINSLFSQYNILFDIVIPQVIFLLLNTLSSYPQVV